MRFIHHLTYATSLSLLALALMTGGCDDNKGTTQTPAAPATPAAGPNASTDEPKAAPVKPLIKPTEIADWCPEHGVPESVCTRCNVSLVAGFKEKGDWDEAHGLPKSQCFECDPSLKDKFAAAYKEKYGKAPPPMSEDEHEHEHEQDEGKSEEQG